jgi:hypothetical protein
MPRAAFVPSTRAPTHIGRFRTSTLADSPWLVRGIPFLAALFGPGSRVVVDAAFGADLHADPTTWQWYDITPDVRQAGGQQVQISPMGRSDGASNAQPAGCGFELDNSSGDYTVSNPNSRWFPYLGQSTPIRVTLNLTGYAADSSIRFQGEANGWTPSWDTSGSVAIVTVSASGVLRRLGKSKSKSPARSALRRFFELTSPRPIAYWPLEDASDALVGASALPGGTAMTASGGTGSASGVKFGIGTQGRTQPLYTGYEITQVGTGPLASLNENGTLEAPIPAGVSSPVAWTIQFVARTFAYTGAGGNDVVLARWLTPGGTYVRWEVVQRSSDGAVQLHVYNLAGAQVVLVDNVFQALDMELYRVQAKQDGANQVVRLFDGRARVFSLPSQANNTDTRVATLARPTYGWCNPTRQSVTATGAANLQPPDIVVGHLGVWDTYDAPDPIEATVQAMPDGTPIYVTAWSGHVGETATDRLARLCAEERVPLVIFGTSTTAMGLQGIDQFLSLIRECETADHGTFYDGRGPGLGYASRAGRYNQSPAVVADMAADPPQVDEPFGPTDDDQRTLNVVKVERKNGSSVIVEHAGGPQGTDAIGVYEGQATLNLHTDDALEQHGAWLTGVGTVEGFRYPRLNLDLLAVPAIAPAWLNAGIVSRVDVVNITSKATQHPPDDLSLLLEGWGESFNPFAWRAGAVCSSHRPYEVHQVEAADNRGRVDSGASMLATDVAAGAGSLSVAVSDGVLWRTGTPPGGSADLLVTIGNTDAGERVTVTDVTGGASPQTFTVTRGVNGVARGWPAGATVRLWRPGRIAL